jgi:hypothetical protein
LFAPQQQKKIIVPLLLTNVTVRRRDSKLARSHLVGQPIDLATRVAKDDCLSNVQRVITIYKELMLSQLQRNISNNNNKKIKKTGLEREVK